MNTSERPPRSAPTRRGPNHVYDCIVIGAGISGLACARTLSDAGLKVVVIEARERIGGRILTTRDPSLMVPIELGAEFIHGAPRVTFDRLDAAGLTFYDLTDKHLQRKGKDLVPMEFFDQIMQVMQTLSSTRAKDRSMHDVIESRDLDPNVKRLLTTYVEGYHAADTHLIGERALALSEQAGDDLNGSEAFRVTEGYDRLCASLVRDTEVRLNTIVKKIRWKKNNVTVEARSRAGYESPMFRAKKVVITIPLGVLKAPAKAQAAIELTPRPKALDSALEALHMGHAMRINFRFRTRFWEDGKKEPVGYLHAGQDKDFPVWWTQAPLRTPIITAWHGGPRVEKLAALSEKERVGTALETLAYLLDVPLKKIQDELVTWYMHDWSNDPFAFGAYSYVGLNGDRKALPLAKPFSDTLYFAGEHTHTAAERGTVDGAIDTGLRAADQILKTSGSDARKSRRS